MDYLAQLAEKVGDEVLACIGCHDCMDACPLPESGTITIAELNEAAQSPRAPTGRAAAFVMACTQCQQCVPVCPAHLNRADMVDWNKIKVEDAAPDRVMLMQDGQRAVASPWTLDGLARELAGMKKLFDGVEQGQLRRMLISCTLRHVPVGTALCREGEYNERLFVVVRGAVEQRAARAAAAVTRLLVLGPGSFHGEMGVLGDQPEPFTIAAVHDAVVLEIGKSTVYRLMRQSGAFRATMDALYARRALWTYIRHSPLLAALPEAAAVELVGQASLRVLEAGETIYREGAPASYLFIVRTGFVSLSRRDRVLQYLGEGQPFGATALLYRQPQSATAKASTRVEVVMVPGDAVQRVLAAHPQQREAIIAKAAAAEARLPKSSVPGESISHQSHVLSLEGLPDLSVIQGHKVLFIDSRICTDCNNCVDACERRHGHARLERSGQQYGAYLVPAACFHCKDPVCLLCSVNGIRREATGEITIVEDLCIGCGACAERCPYNNIQMHPRTPPPPPLPAIRLLDFITGRRTGREITGDALGQLAVKCDLCYGHDDYACVRNCPVGAAIRDDPLTFFHGVLAGAAAQSPAPAGPGGAR